MEIRQAQQLRTTQQHRRGRDAGLRLLNWRNIAAHWSSVRYRPGYLDVDDHWLFGPVVQPRNEEGLRNRMLVHVAVLAIYKAIGRKLILAYSVQRGWYGLATVRREGRVDHPRVVSPSGGGLLVLHAQVPSHVARVEHVVRPDCMNTTFVIR